MRGDCVPPRRAGETSVGGQHRLVDPAGRVRADLAGQRAGHDHRLAGNARHHGQIDDPHALDGLERMLQRRARLLLLYWHHATLPWLGVFDITASLVPVAMHRLQVPVDAIRMRWYAVMTRIEYRHRKVRRNLQSPANSIAPAICYDPSLSRSRRGAALVPDIAAPASPAAV